jgi:lipopolysaccharide biosynthesis glycosyltransferase
LEGSGLNHPPNKLVFLFSSRRTGGTALLQSFEASGAKIFHDPFNDLLANPEKWDFSSDDWRSGHQPGFNYFKWMTPELLETVPDFTKAMERSQVTPGSQSSHQLREFIDRVSESAGARPDETIVFKVEQSYLYAAIANCFEGATIIELRRAPEEVFLSWEAQFARGNPAFYRHAWEELRASPSELKLSAFEESMENWNSREEVFGQYQAMLSSRVAELEDRIDAIIWHASGEATLEWAGAARPNASLIESAFHNFRSSPELSPQIDRAQTSRRLGGSGWHSQFAVATSVSGKRYVEMALVMIRSLWEHNPEVTKVYVAMVEKDKDFFLKAAMALPPEAREILSPLVLSAGVFQGLHFDKWVDFSTWARIFIPEMTEENISWLLYLDADTLVRKPLLGLKSIALRMRRTGVMVAARQHRHQPEEYKAFLKGLGADANWLFNAGVLLVDVKAWKDGDTETELVKLARSDGRIWQYWDQDVLNLHFAGQGGPDYLPLSPYYNTLFWVDGLTDSAIWHYAGARKPSLQRNGTVGEDEWIRYAKMTLSPSQRSTLSLRNLSERLRGFTFRGPV